MQQKGMILPVVFMVLASCSITARAAATPTPGYQPNPAYSPAEQAPYPADQPIYQPDTGVSFAPFASARPTGGQEVTGAPPGAEMQPYAPEGYVDPSYHAYNAGYDPGYGVQTGYEGYLVPSNGIYNQLATSSDEGTLSYLWGLLPYGATVVSVFVHVAKIVLTGAGFLAAGALVVFGLCTFTPLCTVQFPGLNSFALREEVRGLVTPDRVSAAAQFVREAINKYQKLQTRRRR